MWPLSARGLLTPIPPQFPPPPPAPSPQPPAIHCVNFGKSVSKGFTWGKRNQSCIHPQHWTAIPDVHYVFLSIQPCLRALLTRYTSAILQKDERGLGTTEGWLVCWACSTNWLEMISPGSYSPLSRLLRICLFQGHESKNLRALPICRWLRKHFQGLEKGSSFPLSCFVTQPSPLEKEKTRKPGHDVVFLTTFFFLSLKKKTIDCFCAGSWGLHATHSCYLNFFFT